VKKRHVPQFVRHILDDIDQGEPLHRWCVVAQDTDGNKLAVFSCHLFKNLAMDMADNMNQKVPWPDGERPLMRYVVERRRRDRVSSS
jgi:hypothetical protein